MTDASCSPLWETLPTVVQTHIASFTLQVPQSSSIVFYDEYYDDEERKDDYFQSCQPMMTVPSVRLENNRFAVIVHTDALDTIHYDDKSVAWDEHFELNMAKTTDGTIVTGNNSGDFVQIGTIRKRTFTKLVRMSKSFVIRATFISDCDLFDNTWIESTHSNTYSTVRVGMRIDQQSANDQM